MNLGDILRKTEKSLLSRLIQSKGELGKCAFVPSNFVSLSCIVQTLRDLGQC